MNKLSVPENISLRKELWRGFGVPEAVRSIIVSGLVLAAMVVFCFVHQSENDIVVLTIVMIFTIACCVGFFGKISDLNQSIYDFLRKQAAYKKEQQVFLYTKRKEVYRVAQKETKD